MFRVSTHKNTVENLFEKICQLARDKNEKALMELVNQEICLDICYNACTPIMTLARDGYTDAVDLLINKFQCSRNEALMGYAIGGYTHQVNELLKQEINLKDVKFVVSGYAQGGHIKQVNEFFKQVADRDMALAGYARGGHVEQVYELIKQGASFDAAISSSATVGHVDQVNKLIEHRNTASQEDALVKKYGSQNSSVFGYAQGGHVKQVNKLIKEGANIHIAAFCYSRNGHVKEVSELIKKKANLDVIVEGYALGGHVKQVNELLKQGANLNKAVKGYAESGHINQVNKLLKQGADLNMAVLGYAKGGHINRVNELLKQGGSVEKAIKGYMETVNSSNLLKLMSLTDDDHLRSGLADKSKENLPSLNVLQIKKEAKKLNELIRKHSLTFNQAQCYLKAAANRWFFEGRELVRNGTISSVAYRRIGFFIIAEPERIDESGIDKIIDVANQRLRDSMHKMTKKEAETRYQNRMSFKPK